MRNNVLRAAFLLLISAFASAQAQSSFTIDGTVKQENGDPLVGANVYIVDSYAGTITNKNGEFVLRASTSLPFSLVISSIGFKRKIVEVVEGTRSLDIVLSEEILFGDEVVIAASRIEQSLLQSPVSIEKLDILALNQTAGANFYDALYELKGVDMNVMSLTFRMPNTRGFNGNTNYRMTQIVDGMENTPAGLSFAAGNIFGLSPLDVESVELLVGASTALYGPGGLNGTLVMTSKNPFEYQGFSASSQLGMMHVSADYQDSPSPMSDINFRFAQALSSRVAFKVTGSFLQARDWRANDYRNLNDLSNPASTRRSSEDYDGVNVYGDDIIVPVNLKEVAPQVADGVALNLGLQPGTPEYDDLVNDIVNRFPDQVVSRTGWNEESLVDYNTRNLKLAGAVHYRITDNLEAIADGRYANGTAVYTAQNRFSLRNFGIYSGKVELRNPNFNLKVWGSRENAGDSYDAGATALLMNEAWKSSEDWYANYLEGFTQTLLLGSPLTSAFDFGRLSADNRSPQGVIFNQNKMALPIPGTSEFNTLMDQITTVPIGQGGSKVIDRSGMFNVEGMYNLSSLFSDLEMLVGGNYRLYHIDTEGTAFFDTPGNPIHYYQFGGYLQLGKKLLSEKLRLSLATRFDKHQRFEGRFTPRASLVYSLGPFLVHNVRASYQTGFRFPAVADQWVDLDVGAFRVIGGLPKVHRRYGFDQDAVYPLTGTNPILDLPYLAEGPFKIPPFRPEVVRSFEFGYKGIFLGGHLFFDGYYFQNEFEGFMAQQLLVQFPNTTNEQRYQTTISTDSKVRSQGWAAGADYRFERGYVLSSNLSWNALLAADVPPGFLTQFNTPEYRFNLIVSNRRVTPRWGFKIHFRWQDSFEWESNFGVGPIPAFSTLDAQLSYKMESWKSSFKFGGSNILNRYYTTGFGSASVGGLYHITWVFDEFLN